jgi:hypothetical protein
MRILYKLTSRSRPERFLKVIENIKSLARHDDYLILCTLDSDDASMVPYRATLAQMDKVQCFYGRSKSKVDAINRDMEKVSGWDVLFNVSDDQLFLVEGFDTIVLDKVKSVGGDCFLHYPDGNAKDRLATMSIMDYQYYRRSNYIYHPSYISLWCDNEEMLVAKRLGRYFYTDHMIFDHYHPAYKRAPSDEQYRKTESYYEVDKRNFEHRKRLNFRK